PIRPELVLLAIVHRVFGPEALEIGPYRVVLKQHRIGDVDLVDRQRISVAAGIGPVDTGVGESHKGPRGQGRSGPQTKPRRGPAASEGLGASAYPPLTLPRVAPGRKRGEGKQMGSFLRGLAIGVVATAVVLGGLGYMFRGVLPLILGAPTPDIPHDVGAAASS